MKAHLLLFLTQLLCFPSILLSQECRILSFDRTGAFSFSTSGTNLYGGFQYTVGFGGTNSWVNAPKPYWNFSVTNRTMALTFPTGATPFQTLFLRLVCSTNPLPEPAVGRQFMVYGGSAFSTSEPQFFDKGYDPSSYGYTLLGTSTNTSTFVAAYNVYIIRTAPYNVSQVDSVRGSSGLYYSTSITGNTGGWQNIGGPPDGRFAEVGITHLDRGGFVVIDATGANLSSITVYVLP